MIAFREDNHSYVSTDPKFDKTWVGVTSLVGLLKPPFDAVKKSVSSSQNPKSKWYGMDPLEIQKAWSGEGNRSTSAGKWYHTKKENEALSSTEHTVVPPIIRDGIKYAPDQKLVNNTLYPELLVYSYGDGICGQADKVEVRDNRINISDYKTVKALNTKGFVNWEGIPQMMLPPVNHLEDCHLVHYTLQLSIYMYIILRHNPQFLPGILNLEHVIFELESEDKYGFPIYRRDGDGFVVKEVKHYNVPYMKTEVQLIMKYLDNNRRTLLDKLIAKKK